MIFIIVSGRNFDILFCEPKTVFVGLIWRLHNQTVFSYLDLRSDITYSGKVPKSYLLKIIKEFLEWVDAVD